jgi:tetratricopeptide (TPR) repeat protein
MSTMSTTGENAAERTFLSLFPKEVCVDSFNVDTFCAETIALGGTCSERLRKLAIWHEGEYPPTCFGDWRMLEVLYQHAAFLAPWDHRVPHSKGISALELARTLNDKDESHRMYQVATAAFEEALRLDPSSDDIMYMLGLCHYFDDEQDASDAKRWFYRALDSNPNMARARLYLGHCLQDDGDWRGALVEYDKIDQEQLFRELQPWHLNRLREQIGYCHAKLGQRPEAVQLLSSVLKLYEEAEPDNLPEDIIGYPSELIDTATSELADELFDRVEKCVIRHGWEPVYAQELARGRKIRSKGTVEKSSTS